MKTQISALALVALGLLATPILAQPEERRGEGDRPRGAARERILRAFDKDGDGRLNQEERDAVREQLGDRFDEIRRQVRGLFEERRDGEAREDESRRRDRDARDREPQRRDGDRDRRPRRDDDGDRPRDAGPRDRGPRDRGVRDRRPSDRALRDAPRPGGPLGPIGPTRGGPDRDLQALFGWFDTNGDNMLDRREFAELSQFVQRRRPMPPGSPRVGWRTLGGPDEPRIEQFRLERRRAFERAGRDEDGERRAGDRRDGAEVRDQSEREIRDRRNPENWRRPAQPNRQGDAPRDDDRAAARRTIQAI